MSTETLTWVEPDGTTTAWPVELLRGLEGRGLPPVKHRLEEVPGRPGAILWNTRHAARRIVIPILFQGLDTAVRTALRAWAYRLDSSRGAGLLRVATLDGSTREIGAAYAGGLELVEDNAWTLPATVEFVCPDPYWQDSADQTADASSGISVVAWFPIFPLQFTASDIAVGVVALNDGDVPVWPVITLTGPMANPTIVNTANGKTLQLATTIGAGGTVVLDARQDYRSVTGPAGQNWYPYLTPGSEWWQLERGSNTVNVNASGTTGDSAIQLSWRRKFLTV